MARVLFIANTYPHWTGTDAAGLALIRRIAARGHHVTVLQTWSTILEPHLADIAGVTTVRVPGDNMLFEQMTHGWLRVLRAHRSDVCILNKGYYVMRDQWLDVAARLSSRRYVVLEQHPADPPPPPDRGSVRWWKGRAAFRLHYAAAADVVTISPAVRDRLRAWYLLPRHKGIVVPHGIDVDAFRFEAAGRQRLRHALGVGDDVFLFGAVGRLAHEKGYDRLLPVFAELVAASGHEHLRLVVAGVGSEADALAREAQRLGIADRVIFPGWIAAADHIPFLSALDCFVMPSRVEGQGLALLEAMACERPSIGIECGGVEQTLTDPAVGWLAPADDMGAFGRAMREVVALSPEQRAAVGARARRHVETYFNIHRQIDRMVDVLLGPFAEQVSSPGHPRSVPGYGVGAAPGG